MENNDSTQQPQGVDTAMARKVYDNVSTHFDIGGYNEYLQHMGTPDGRKKFHTNVSQHFDIGDYETFENNLKPKEPTSSQPPNQPLIKPQVQNTVQEMKNPLVKVQDPLKHDVHAQTITNEQADEIIQKVEKEKEYRRQIPFSDMIVKGAQTMGSSVKDYMSNYMAKQQADEFLDEKEKKVFDVLYGYETAKKLYEQFPKKLGYKVQYESVKANYDEAMDQLFESTRERKKTVEDLLTKGYKTEQMPGQIHQASAGVKQVPLTTQEKQNLKQELNSIDGQLKNYNFFTGPASGEEAPGQFPHQQDTMDFLNANKMDIGVKYPQLVKLLPENPTAQDIMRAYYNVMYAEFRKLGEDVGPENQDAILGNIKSVAHTALPFTMSKDEEQYLELGKKLKSLAPIALLNTYHDTEEDKGMADVFLKNMAKSLYPEYKGTTKTEQAQNISQALQHLDIDASQLNKKAVDMVTKVGTPSMTEEIVGGIGSVLGDIPRLMLLGSVIEGASAATGLNNTIKALKASEKITDKAASFMLRSGKDVALFSATGDNHPIQDGIGFRTGIEGFESLFGKFGKLAAPIMNKIYSDAAGSQAESFLKGTGKFIGAGAGITAGTEMSNYTSALANSLFDDKDFKEELGKRGYLDKDGNWTLSHQGQQLLKEFTINSVFGFLTLKPSEFNSAKTKMNDLKEELKEKGIDEHTQEVLDNFISKKEPTEDERDKGIVKPTLEDAYTANHNVMQNFLESQRPKYDPNKTLPAPVDGAKMFLPLPKQNVIKVWDRNTGENKQIYPDQDGWYTVKKEFGYPADAKFKLLADGNMMLAGDSPYEVELAEGKGLMLKPKKSETQQTPEPPKTEEEEKKIEQEKKGVVIDLKGEEKAIDKKAPAKKKSTGTVESTDGTVKPIDKSSAPEKKKEPEKPKTEEVEDGKKDDKAREFRANISDINTNVDKFQNRNKEFSEETVKSITGDIEKGTFDENKLDPIRVWKDPKDGKYYVLAGHSRLESYKKAAEKDKKYESIPSIDMSYLTEDQAIDFATKESNVMGTKESPIDRSKIYRKMMEEGKSKTSIQEEAKKLEQKNWKYVYNLSHLAKEGKTLSDISAFEKTTDEDNKKKTERMGDFIGELKTKHPELSLSQENELNQYLWDNFDKHPSKQSFVEFADKRIESLKKTSGFTSDTPINLERQVSKSQVERNYENKLTEYKDRFDQARKNYEDKKNEFVSRGAGPEELGTAIKPYETAYDKARDDYADMLRQRSMIKEAAKTQISLWDMMDTAITKQIEDVRGKLKEESGKVYSSLVPITPQMFHRIHLTALQLAKTLIRAGKSTEYIMERVNKFIASQTDRVQRFLDKHSKEMEKEQSEEKKGLYKKEIETGEELRSQLGKVGQDIETILKSEKTRILPEGERYDDEAAKRMTDKLKLEAGNYLKEQMPIEDVKNLALDHFNRAVVDIKKLSSGSAQKIIDSIRGAKTDYQLVKALDKITSVIRKEQMGELYDEASGSKSFFKSAKEKPKYAPLYEELSILSKIDTADLSPEDAVLYNSVRQMFETTPDKDLLTQVAGDLEKLINARVSESGMKKRVLTDEQKQEYRDVLKKRASDIPMAADFTNLQKQGVEEFQHLLKKDIDSFGDLELQQADELLDQLDNGWVSPAMETVIAKVKANREIEKDKTYIKTDMTATDKWHKSMLNFRDLAPDRSLKKLFTAMDKVKMSEFLSFIKDGITNPIYNNTLGKMASTAIKYEVQRDAMQKPIRDAINKLGESDYDRNVALTKIGMYAYTAEGYPEALQFVQRSMLNMEAAGFEKKNKDLHAVHKDAYATFMVDEKGKLRTKEELWNKLTEQEKQFYQMGRDMLDNNLKEKSQYVTTNIRGEHFTPIENYWMRNLAGLHQGEIGEISGTDLHELLMGNKIDPSKYFNFTATSSYERKDPDNGYYNLNAGTALLKHANDVLFYSEMAKPYKEAMSYINHPGLKDAMGDVRHKAFKDEFVGSLNSIRQTTEDTWGTRLVNGVFGAMRTNALADVARPVAEFSGQVLTTFLNHGVPNTTRAMQNFARHSGKVREFLEMVGSPVAKDVWQSFDEIKDKNKKLDMFTRGDDAKWLTAFEKSDVATMSRIYTNYMGNIYTCGWRFANVIDWMANFDKAHEARTGNKFDWDSVADPKDLLVDYAKKNTILESSLDANRLTAKSQGPSDRFSDASKFTKKEGVGAMYQFIQSSQWFLSKFTRVLGLRAWDATADLVKGPEGGSGRSRANAALDLLGSYGNTIIYKYAMTQLGALMVQGYYSAFSSNPDDYEKTRIAQKAKEQFTLEGLGREATSSILDTYLGTFSMTGRFLLGSMFEEVNKTARNAISDKPYNYKEDSFTFYQPPSNSRSAGDFFTRKLLTNIFYSSYRNTESSVDDLEKLSKKMEHRDLAPSEKMQVADALLHLGHFLGIHTPFIKELDKSIIRNTEEGMTEIQKIHEMQRNVEKEAGIDKLKKIKKELKQGVAP